MTPLPKDLQSLSVYCNQLGMVIGLTYCLRMNEGLPCRNAIGCWSQRTDIRRILRESFGDDELRKVFASPPISRVERILESARKGRLCARDSGGQQ
ncbi:MAG TPA: hypothetical protein VLD40_04900 [Dissulfurispiraceae bacterium]|nr:hypothetical protein [Dissulfurispiraceae bacterium]